MKKLSVLLMFFCLFTGFAFAQGGAFTPEVKRVAVFKNGYAFTYREGEAQISNGWAYTTNAPTGVLGTIWGYSTLPNVKVMQMLASQSEKSETKRVGTTLEILYLNEGSKIRFMDDDDKKYEGTYQVLGQSLLTAPTGTMFSAEAMTVAVKTETGTLFFPFGNMKNIEILGQPKMEREMKTKENRLMMKVDGAKDGQNINLGIASMERGIRWIPAYRVEARGTPVKEAKLELEAMVINELTDLKNSEVYFVVGVPHFLFQESISPLSMNSAFSGVSSYFSPGAGGSRRDSMSNAIMTQVASQSVTVGGETNDSNYIPDALPTVSDAEKSNSFSADQLFLYQANDINLKKGERATLRLFSLTVPASEVFEWTLTDASDTQNRYLEYGRGSTTIPIVQDLSSKVWYGLRLKNQTGMPWTTAPAISFRDWKPIGQDMLTFTPVNGENILRVTPATEVIGTHTLEEKSRERTQLRYSGSMYDFDLVTVEGTIKLRNVKKDTVEVVITRDLVGEALSATDSGAISRQGFNLQAINPNSVVKWNLKVPTGEKEVRYTYKIYVRR
jgi:hypothetical protein